MTQRRVELTSLQIKTLEVASMDYVHDQYNHATERDVTSTGVTIGINVEKSYLYQRGLYLHFLLSRAKEVIIIMEDRDDDPSEVPPHQVYGHMKGVPRKKETRL